MAFFPHTLAYAALVWQGLKGWENRIITNVNATNVFIWFYLSLIAYHNDTYNVTIVETLKQIGKATSHFQVWKR